MFGQIKDQARNVLTSRGFLAGLILLLANDFVFKPHFHNAFTGKLSDFAGLFVFPLFVTCIVPRFRALIYAGTAAVFVLWKSQYSTGLIEYWNSITPFRIARTIDYTDLWTLTILPVSYVYGMRANGFVRSRLVAVLMALVTVFAFAATSFSHKTPYDNSYQFTTSKRELLQRMSQLSKGDVNSFLFWEADNFTVDIESCLEADFEIMEANKQSVLTLKQTDYRCSTPPSKAEMLQTFELEFVNKLNENPVQKSAKIRMIYGLPTAEKEKPGSKGESKSSINKP